MIKNRLIDGVLLLAVAALLLPATARAQGGVNGSIVGNVFDQTGAPIKGVKIVAKSPTQIGGAKTAYSNDEGFFRIPGLLPGKFELTASAPKLKTVIQKDIDVGIEGPANVDVIMEVEVTNVEEVKVVEKAPVVSTTSAKVSTTFDADFIDGLPTESRTHHEQMIAANTPGGYENGLRGARFRGGSNNQNSFNVEGFRMNGQKVTVKSLAAMEVSTAGYGAENASVAGGVVNMVSKSGSNKYELDVSGHLEDSYLRFFKDESDSENHSYKLYVNPAFSGPIVKDHLWFYLNTEARREYTYRDWNPNNTTLGPPPPREYLNTRTALKLTWQVTPRNKLQSYQNFNRDWHWNNGSQDSDELEAYEQRGNIDQFHGLIWESLLTDSLFLRSQIGFQQQRENILPMLCRQQPEDCDHIRQIRNSVPRSINSNNYATREQRTEQSIEIVNQLEWFAHSKIFGEHNIKAKSRLYFEMFESAKTYNGDGYIQYSGATPSRERTYFSNDPRKDGVERMGYFIRGTSGLTTVHSVQDSMRLTKYLTFTPGAAFTTSRAANVGQAADLDNSAITPHVAVAWDATHDGRTVVRGSYNQYVDVDTLRLARHILGDAVYRECEWNSGNEKFDRNCTWGGGASRRTIGQPCGPTGVDFEGNPCKEKLKMPKTYEYTAGAEREIVQGVGLGADLVYRLYTYPYEKRETNRIWAPSGLVRDQLFGYRNGVSESIDDLSTPAAARRRYLGITTSVKKREGALKLQAHYTWAMLVGNTYADEGGAFGSNPVRDEMLYGYLSDDARHTIKTSLTYQLTKWMSTGFIWRYYSGRPLSRYFRNVQDGDSWNDLRARVGINPGANINDPGDDRPARTWDINEFNVQLRANLKPLTGQNFDAFVDFTNILALRTPTGFEQNDNGRWGQPTSSRKGPMAARLGFRWRY